MEEKDFSNLSDENRENLSRSGQNWNSASAIRGDDGYNPNSLSDLENSSVSGEKAAENDILPGENSPWKTNFNQGGTHKSRNQSLNTKSGRTRKFLKAKIAAGVLAGGSTIGIGIGSLFTAGLAPIHVTEIITEKINSAASIMDIRSSGLMSNKYKTKGAKCSVIRAACKFEKVSAKQKAKLEKSGFEVEVDADGRISKLTHVDTKVEITEANLKQKLKTDPNLKNSMNKAYSGKFASFLDDVAEKFMSKFKLSKVKADNSGKTETELDTEMTKKANDTSKKANLTAEESNEEVEEGDPDADEKNRKNKTSQENKGLVDDLKSDAPELAKADIKTRANALTAKFKKVANLGELPCTLYSLGNMINIGVKVVRAVAITQFALSFLSFAHKIKSGQPTTEEYAMIGNKMMAYASESSDEKSENTEKQSKIERAINYFAESANSTSKKGFTDSQGYRALAYNDSIGKLDDSAYKFTLGASGAFFNWFQKIRNMLINLTKGNITTTCKFMTSTAYDLLDIGLDIIIGLGTAGIGVLIKEAAEQLIMSELIGAAIGYALEGLPSLLSGEVVNEKTRGEDYGNAVLSGSGSLMSKNTISGGGSTLTKAEAVAFYQENEILIAENGAYERSIRSPLDPTTRHTFLGSIVSSIIPYQSSIATISGFIPSMISIASRSISNILPGASAADTAGFEANMNICQDDDIKQLGIATDPFCNPYTGISTTTLRKDSSEVIQYLADNSQIDPSVEDPRSAVKSNSELEKYIKDCSERNNPIGVGEDANTAGISCSTYKNEKTAYFAAYLTDIRIQEGMDDDFQPIGSSSSSASNRSVNPGDWHMPIQGVTSWKMNGGMGPDQDYGPRNVSFDPFHDGIDLGLWANGAKTGTPVYTIGDGTVEFAGKDSSGMCGENFVLIKHTSKVDGKDVYSSYCHMESKNVKTGDKITASNQIGTVGCRGEGCLGNSISNSHLHLTVMSGSPDISNSKDPVTFLNGLGIPLNE